MDTHSVFEDPILSLSLGSACVMDFRCGDKKIALDLPARSLLVMSGDARYAWSHGICPRRNDNVQTGTGFSTRSRGTRLSFTFRKIRRKDCECSHVEYCDSQRSSLPPEITPIDATIASELEMSCVHGVSFYVRSAFPGN